jgi:hypothetical protein
MHRDHAGDSMVEHLRPVKREAQGVRAMSSSVSPSPAPDVRLTPASSRYGHVVQGHALLSRTYLQTTTRSTPLGAQDRQDVEAAVTRLVPPCMHIPHCPGTLADSGMLTSALRTCFR